MRNGPVIKIGPGEEFPKDIPPQYLQGWVEFYKLKFKVNPDVLIPRSETELLVDEILDFVIARSSERIYGEHSRTSRRAMKQSITILDVGTGSGNIAISIAKNLPHARIFATDVSEAALEVARENARKHRVKNRIFFIKSDLLSNFHDNDSLVYFSKGKASSAYHTRNIPDIIVANLPYIPTSRIDYLDPSVKDFEPRVALDGGPDGFDLYRKLFAQIKEKFLNNQMSYDRSTNEYPLKLIVCEIDYTQGELAALEAQKLMVSEVEPCFPDAKIEVKTDLAKKQRILVIKLL